ncbi:MAG: XRE family transcriptional regulator [Candidatus Aminicenantales bacterium]
MPDTRIFSAKLKKLREETGLSQSALARALGLSSVYISRLEAGKRMPSFSTLQKIATYLNKDIAYFFERKEDIFDRLFQAEGLDPRARDEFHKFRRYSEEYLRLEAVTGRRLELAPLYANVSPERMADEERRRLGLGEEPIRDIFALCEMNGCRILRMPLNEEYKVAGVFIYLEVKGAAFALVNSAQSVGRQVFSAAHEYGHYLKDRLESPVIDNPDMFIDEYVSLYHPREQFAQAFAARFLMPPGKIQEIVAKDLRSQKLSFNQVLYLKRYFGVSPLSVLSSLRSLNYLSRSQLNEYRKLDPAAREKELFGNIGNGNEGKAAESRIRKSQKKIIPSDRFKLLQQEAARIKEK